MRSQATTPQLDEAALRASGWTVLRSLLLPDELAALHAAWDRLEANGPTNNWGPRETAGDTTFLWCASHSVVRQAITCLLGEAFSVRTVDGRAPPKDHGQQGLHIDWKAPTPPERQIIVNAFFLLDAMSDDNGGTRIVPGSHLWGRAPGKEFGQPLARHPQQQIVSASAGDVLVFSGHLWHSGTVNRSGRRRRVVRVLFGVPELGRAPV